MRPEVARRVLDESSLPELLIAADMAERDEVTAEDAPPPSTRE